jgi:hypothetical protein
LERRSTTGSREIDGDLIWIAAYASGRADLRATYPEALGAEMNLEVVHL